MKIVIQRVSEASVKVDNEIVGTINKGYMLLVGIEHTDTINDLQKAADKISQLRIFEDHEGKMNLDIIQVEGSILSVSQFTLAASIKKGNRPGFSEAMEPIKANDYFNQFNELLRSKEIHVETGVFQADMKVSLINDGPVTIIMEVKDGKVL